MADECTELLATLRTILYKFVTVVVLTLILRLELGAHFSSLQI